MAKTFSDLVNEQRNKNNGIAKMDDAEVRRIAHEMLQIAIDEFKFDGINVTEWDVIDKAYDRWEEENGKLDHTIDEYGDEDDYNQDVYDELDSLMVDYKKKHQKTMMDKILDLEYNDLVEFAGYGQYYVKSTNGNDTIDSCKIWAGPNEHDDSGWYFYASDFVEVIEPSYSGESIFGF